MKKATMKPLQTMWWSAVLALPLAAQAQLVPVHWGADGVFRQEMKIAPGKFLEVCDKLPGGTQVQWKFTGSDRTDFNIHYHEGKKVRFPAQEEGAAASQGTLAVSSEQDYCWMWSNKGTADVTLGFELRKR